MADGFGQQPAVFSDGDSRVVGSEAEIQIGGTVGAGDPSASGAETVPEPGMSKPLVDLDGFNGLGHKYRLVRISAGTQVVWVALLYSKAERIRAMAGRNLKYIFYAVFPLSRGTICNNGAYLLANQFSYQRLQKLIECQHVVFGTTEAAWLDLAGRA